jgi:hypothetical protein
MYWKDLTSHCLPLKPCGQDYPKVDWRHFLLYRVRNICSYAVPWFPHRQPIKQMDRGRCLKAGERGPNYRWCLERSQSMTIIFCVSSFFDEITVVRPGSPDIISSLAETLRIEIVSVPWHNSRSGSCTQKTLRKMMNNGKKLENKRWLASLVDEPVAASLRDSLWAVRWSGRDWTVKND